MLDFGGSSSTPSVNLGYAGQNATIDPGHNLKAVLFVFHPSASKFGNVGMRSFQYQFDDNFLGATQEITDIARRGAAGSGQIMQQFMDQRNLSDYMVASQQPNMVFQSSNLSDKYHFILVLTDKGAGVIGASTIASSLASSQVRRIYNGYFMDEPFNLTTMTDTKRTLNPHSTMIITHKTVVGTSTESGPYGARHLINTRSSEEVINSEVSRSFMAHAGADNSIHLMTPSNCMMSIDVTSDGYAMAAPGAVTDISRDHGVQTISDVLEQPTHNVAQVVKGLMRHQDDVTTRGRLMTGRTEALFENDLMEDSATRANLGRFMDIPRSKPLSMFDLDLNSVHTAKSIDDMVNQTLEVVDFDHKRPMFYETADQMQQGITEQYSYLIAMVIPAVLNAAGLNAMQFVYEVKRAHAQVMENFTTVAAEPHWPMPPQELFNTAKAVEMELRRGILQTIFDSKGDYRVEVTVNTTGMTVVRLDLIGQGCRCLADFEIPSCLGGLISPIIGDSRSYTANSEQLTGMYATATGMSHGLGGFNQNDHDFMQFAQQGFEERSLLGHGYEPGEVID